MLGGCFMRLKEFQQLMLDLYGERDARRGLEKTLLWLGSEIGELLDDFLKGQPKKKIEEELADIIAWTCSVANLLDIDLENACRNKYPNECPRCHSNPCKCPFI